MVKITKYETQNGFAYRLVRYKLGHYNVGKIIARFTI